MRLLRVGGAGETVSIRGVISLAARNSVSFCNPASNPTRVSCVAALGWSGARAGMFCCGELMFFARLWDCASANGMAQMARSESSMSALRRKCALMEGLICFFTVVSSCAAKPMSIWLLHIHNHGVVRLYIHELLVDFVARLQAK